MIKRRTTLVLGAGASAPYGFPLGRGLRDALLNPDSPFENWLAHLNARPNAWAEVQETLRASHIESVDEFLAKYPEHARLVKLAVANELNKAEVPKVQFDPRRVDHWYYFLLNEVLRNDANLLDGQLTIVTFNYDNSLEEFFRRTLPARFKFSSDEAIDRLTNLRVAHVYGSIETPAGVNQIGRDYGRFEYPELLGATALGISTCYEAGSVAAIEEAQRQIHESEAVIFLGFGYSEQNLKRLDLKKHLRADTRVLGSTWRDPGAAERLAPHLPNPHKFVTSVPPAQQPPVAEPTIYLLRSLVQMSNDDGRFQ